MEFCRKCFDRSDAQSSGREVSLKQNQEKTSFVTELYIPHHQRPKIKKIEKQKTKQKQKQYSRKCCFTFSAISLTSVGVY